MLSPSVFDCEFKYPKDRLLTTELLLGLQIHSGPVKVMKYNPVQDVVVSADAKGLLEYWSPSTLKFPEDVYVLASWSYFQRHVSSDLPNYIPE